MEIESLISEDLWQEIKGLYTTQNYSSAVFEAVKYLTRLIREKTGLDGDGYNLMARAFGGQDPVLKLNKLQTETEKDIQKGFLFLTQGIYLTIRNPRGHDKKIDDQKTADALILFIDHLISEIVLAIPPYTIDEFIFRVNDNYFVKTKDYAKALVEEIPKNRLFDTLVEVYRSIRLTNEINIGLIIKEILPQITDSQKNEFLSIVSKNLKTTTNITKIRLTFRILSSNEWKLIEKSAKLRVENQLLNSIVEGECIARNELIEDKGALGTWSSRYLHVFDDVAKVQRIILDKLKRSYAEKLYVFSYFIDSLPDLFAVTYYTDEYIFKILNDAISDRGYRDTDDILSIMKTKMNSLPNKWTKAIVDVHPYLEEDDIPF